MIYIFAAIVMGPALLHNGVGQARYCMNLAATVNVILYDRAAKQARGIRDEQRVETA